jgi:hypothetical protein
MTERVQRIVLVLHDFVRLGIADSVVQRILLAFSSVTCFLQTSLGLSNTNLGQLNISNRVHPPCSIEHPPCSIELILCNNILGVGFQAH